MAPKPRNPKPPATRPPPSTDSSGDDEEPEKLPARYPSKTPAVNAPDFSSSDSEDGRDEKEEESSSDDERPSPPAPKPAAPKAPPALGSSGESESESESESGSAPTPAPMNSKTVAQLSSKSKKTWGSNSSGGAIGQTIDHDDENRPMKRQKPSAVAAGKKKNIGVAVDGMKESIDFGSYPFLWNSIDFPGRDYVKNFAKKNGLTVSDRIKVESLNKEFQKLAMAERELQLKRSELRTEAILFIAKGMEKSD